MYTSGMGGAENFPAGQGEGENPRGGAGRGKKHINWLIQKFDKSAWIVIEIFLVHYDVLKGKGKHILSH